MRPRLVLEGKGTRVPAGQPEGTREATRRLTGAVCLRSRLSFSLGIWWKVTVT